MVGFTVHQRERAFGLGEIASAAILTGPDRDGAADVTAVRWIGGETVAVSSAEVSE